MLDFEDTAEFENATKGQIASPDTLDIYDENGKLVWSQTAMWSIYRQLKENRQILS